MPDFLRAGPLVFAVVAVSALGEDDAQALTRLRSEMDAVISHNRTCSNLVHCRVLPVGYDECGNPTEFLAFNDLRGIRGELEGKVAEFNFIVEEQRRAKPRPANCKIAVTPAPACINNHCVLGSKNY